MFTGGFVVEKDDSNRGIDDSNGGTADKNHGTGNFNDGTDIFMYSTDYGIDYMDDYIDGMDHFIDGKGDGDAKWTTFWSHRSTKQLGGIYRGPALPEIEN